MKDNLVNVYLKVDFSVQLKENSLESSKNASTYKMCRCFAELYEANVMILTSQKKNAAYLATEVATLV